MRRTFSGYFPATESELEELWREALIVLDANVLLNLYRYSTATRNDLIGLFRALQTRLWLPHQAGEEFLENRVGVIDSQIGNCRKILKDSDAMLTEVDSQRGHPFVTKELREELGSATAGLRQEMAASINELEGYVTHDPILDALAGFFDSRVGPPLSADEIKTLIAEGEERYRKEIPPGFEDRKKPTEQRRYGDLILWKQILREVGANKRAVIFVTDDLKKTGGGVRKVRLSGHIQC